MLAVVARNRGGGIVVRLLAGRKGERTNLERKEKEEKMHSRSHARCETSFGVAHYTPTCLD